MGVRPTARSFFVCEWRPGEGAPDDAGVGDRLDKRVGELPDRLGNADEGCEAPEQHLSGTQRGQRRLSPARFQKAGEPLCPAVELVRQLSSRQALVVELAVVFASVEPRLQTSEPKARLTVCGLKRRALLLGKSGQRKADDLVERAMKLSDEELNVEAVLPGPVGGAGLGGVGSLGPDVDPVGSFGSDAEPAGSLGSDAEPAGSLGFCVDSARKG